VGGDSKKQKQARPITHAHEPKTYFESEEPKMKKKILAAILAVAMLLSMGVVALADEETTAGLLLVEEDEDGPEIPPDDCPFFPVSVADFGDLDFGEVEIEDIMSPGAETRNSSEDARNGLYEFGVRFVSHTDFTLQVSISGFGVDTGSGIEDTLTGTTLTFSNATADGATAVTNLVPGEGGAGTVVSGSVSGNVWTNVTSGVGTPGTWVLTTGGDHTTQGTPQNFLVGTEIDDLAVNWRWATNLVGLLSIPAFAPTSYAGETRATIEWTVVGA
jgi:hypothetical protein